MLLIIGLLAIIVAVYVLAVSLLGRAIEEAGREKRQILQKEAEELDDQIKKMREELAHTEAAVAMEEIKRKLNEYGKNRSKTQKALKRADEKYRPLAVTGSVLWPGAFFVLALLLAGGARYTTTTATMTWAASVLWGLSLPLLAYGGYLVYQSLRVIQNVAITSEETQQKKMVEALRTALGLHDESKRPIVELRFEEGLTPLKITKGSVVELHMTLGLERGDVARNVEVFFMSKEAFEFPDSSTWYRSKQLAFLPGALSTKVKFGDIISNMSYHESLKVKPPPQAGNFRLWYISCCEGFLGGTIKRCGNR